MKIVVTGAKGQLASEIVGVLNSQKSEIGKIPFEYEKNICVEASIDELDITNCTAVNDFILAQKPDILINCAALTDVDGCETNIDLALKVNAIGPRNLAIACNKCGAKLVHISTDYVFDGAATKPYREWDLPNPQSIYGKSKLLGEVYIKEQMSKYFIVRTSWLYGYTGNNFVKTMLKLGQEKDQIKVVNDQRGNPTNANDLAYHILKIALSEEYGIYHCTGQGECTWFDFAKKIMSLEGLSCKVLPCTTDEFPRLAKRPGFSSLDNLMLRATVGDEMRNWEVALEEYLRKLS
ncbi:MAG: dTDP-4-dehydrorhamnose reductase [Eubacteriales bacterium SKADARSKE-1]|nr:dTDP-4-dehydrorhamnose reductase [Eubacteriales bacterium SKADARSKE-1]